MIQSSYKQMKKTSPPNNWRWCWCAVSVVCCLLALFMRALRYSLC